MNTMKFYDVEDDIPMDSPGMEHPFSNPWIFWSQNTPYNEHDKTNYELVPICRFTTIAGLWTFVCDFDLANKSRVTIMREGITPKWEDPAHNGGGNLFIYIDCINTDSYDLFINCFLGIIGETFTKKSFDSLDITGITFVNELKFKQLRIWSSDSTLEIGKVRKEFTEILMSHKINLVRQIRFTSFAVQMEKAARVETDTNDNGMYHAYIKRPDSLTPRTYIPTERSGSLTKSGGRNTFRPEYIPNSS